MTQIEKEQLSYEQFMYRAHSVPLDSKCIKCGSIKNLERHHEQYENPEVFITICRKCHRRMPKTKISLILPRHKNPKRSSMYVTSDTLSVFQELSEKTHIPIADILRDIAKEIKIIISDGMPEPNRISYMPKAFLDKSCVVLHFSTLTCGIGEESLKQLLEKKSISGTFLRLKE